MSLDDLNREVTACRRCPRLVEWREHVARTKRRAYQHWEYWGRPVPGFGDPHAGVMIVGLAPGAHGSNRTGRMFTGDASGDFLYAALHRAGFASQTEARHRADGLILTDAYITAVCRCAPPGNKPTFGELNNCQPFLAREIEMLHPKVIVCLGRIAFERLKRMLFISDPSVNFAHGASYQPNTDSLITNYWLLASYHPSQQNTQTRRLTVEMFDVVWTKVRSLLDGREP